MDQACTHLAFARCDKLDPFLVSPFDSISFLYTLGTSTMACQGKLLHQLKQEYNWMAGKNELALQNTMDRNLMEPEITYTTAFTLIGIAFTANVRETEAEGLIGKAYAALEQLKPRLPEGTEHLYLLQQYPGHAGFDPFRDAFTQMVSYRLDSTASALPGTQVFEVPAGKGVRLRYQGPDSGLAEAYDLLYRRWIPEQNLEPLCHDFEYWGRDYRPDDASSVYELFIPVAAEPLQDACSPG